MLIVVLGSGGAKEGGGEGGGGGDFAIYLAPVGNTPAPPLVLGCSFCFYLFLCVWICFCFWGAFFLSILTVYQMVKIHFFVFVLK